MAYLLISVSKPLKIKDQHTASATQSGKLDDRYQVPYCDYEVYSGSS